MSTVWFTSDEHFGHANIIDFCHRPFNGLEDMREKLIANHNSVVKPGDRVYHLGDMFWRTLSAGEALSIIYRLNGQHFYIRGNHEELIDKNKELREAFVWVRDVENLKNTGFPNVWLAHYAHRVWNGSHRGGYHLYGHTHNALPNDGSLSFDCGVDAQNFHPISLEEVHERMQAIKKESEGKIWRCKNEKCTNWFVARDTNPKTCAKCKAGMELR